MSSDNAGPQSSSDGAPAKMAAPGLSPPPVPLPPAPPLLLTPPPLPATPDPTAARKWVVAIAVSLLALGLMVWAVVYYVMNVTLGGVIVGAFAGAVAGMLGGACVGFFWGKHREKAALGPLPPLGYAASADKLRKDFLH